MAKQVQLQDVEHPNLFREQFPYSELPKVFFDGQDVPIENPQNIWITDTTFRDGQQARPPYRPEQIARIYEYLHQINGTTDLIRQSEFFLYSDKDKKAVELCREKGYKFPEITGWIRATVSDFRIVKELGLKETGILTSASDYHIFLKLKMTRQQALNAYLDVVKASLDTGILPRCHFEDITRADFDGFILPFAAELLKLSQQYKTPVKMRLCDTLGFGVPWATAKLPRSIPKMVYALRQLGVPGEWLEWHGHNDLHKVEINAATAWLYGCCAANTSIFGVGERTGNPPLEALVMEHAQLRGTNPNINYEAITELARYAGKELNFDIPANYPLVGRDFNVTRAGIHADGLLKNEEIYNCFDTLKYLKRPVGVAITDKTGAAGIKHWLEDRFQVEVGKQDPQVLFIKDKIDAEYTAERMSAITDMELEQWTKEAFGDKMPPRR